MLNIYLGDMENAIYHPPVYFDNTYEDEWITDELSVKMIKDIDKSDVIGPHLVLFSRWPPWLFCSFSRGKRGARRASAG